MSAIVLTLLHELSPFLLAITLQGRCNYLFHTSIKVKSIHYFGSLLKLKIQLLFLSVPFYLIGKSVCKSQWLVCKYRKSLIYLIIFHVHLRFFTTSVFTYGDLVLGMARNYDDLEIIFHLSVHNKLLFLGHQITLGLYLLLSKRQLNLHGK